MAASRRPERVSRRPEREVFFNINEPVPPSAPWTELPHFRGIHWVSLQRVASYEWKDQEMVWAHATRFGPMHLPSIASKSREERVHKCSVLRHHLECFSDDHGTPHGQAGTSMTGSSGFINGNAFVFCRHKPPGTVAGESYADSGREEDMHGPHLPTDAFLPDGHPNTYLQVHWAYREPGIRSLRSANRAHIRLRRPTTHGRIHSSRRIPSEGGTGARSATRMFHPAGLA